MAASADIVASNAMTNLKINANKAGMNSLDIDKVNSIIFEASKGSKYFEYQKKRQEVIQRKIDELLARLHAYSAQQTLDAERKMDLVVKRLDEGRDLSRVIVHVDMDAFYAAVEIRDNPSLKQKPMAVGSQHMLSTSNYEARKFGVRAGMPGFMAKKLCPTLILVEPNFEKYSAASKEVQTIFAEYDKDYCSMSLDEAYLDITSYMDHLNMSENDDGNKISVETVVAGMRDKIFQKTRLTASAGIASNTMLAKVCSDINKPNNQFRLEADKEVILDFMRKLPIRKVCGIGSVTEQQLNALGVINCGDLYEHRGKLHLLFSSISSQYFIRIALGIGSTVVKNDDSRKSMSVERTFQDTSAVEEMQSMCNDLCKMLVNDLEEENIFGKTITLKLKLTDFTVRSRSCSIDRFTRDGKLILRTAKKLLSDEIKSSDPAHPLSLRLMGVRMSNLADEDEAALDQQQLTLSQFFKDSLTDKSNSMTQSASDKTDGSELDTRQTDPDLESTLNSTEQSSVGDDLTSYTCPICNKGLTSTLLDFNQHIDVCLNSKTVKEMVRVENQNFRTSQGGKSSPGLFGSQKRERSLGGGGGGSANSKAKKKQKVVVANMRPINAYYS